MSVLPVEWVGGTPCPILPADFSLDGLQPDSEYLMQTLGLPAQISATIGPQRAPKRIKVPGYLSNDAQQLYVYLRQDYRTHDFALWLCQTLDYHLGVQQMPLKQALQRVDKLMFDHSWNHFPDPAKEWLQSLEDF